MTFMIVNDIRKLLRIKKSLQFVSSSKYFPTDDFGVSNVINEMSLPGCNLDLGPA